MGIMSDTGNRDFDIEKVRIREAGYSDVDKHDKWLDAKYGKDRPKCRICGGRLDGRMMFRRCPWCGAGQEVRT